MESETLEVKNWCSNERQLGEKAGDSAACLANLRGGLVLLGIENGDKGIRKFSSCPYPNVTPEWLTQRIQDHTVPPVEIEVVDAGYLLKEVTGNSAADCYAVFVARSKRIGGHQTVGGVSRIRSGKDCRPYYVAQDDRTKAPVVSADLNSLSASSIAWGVQQHRKKFGLTSEQWESDSSFLISLGLLEPSSGDGRICDGVAVTLAGLLLFGTEAAIKRHCPGLETILITPIGEKRICGNITDCFRQLCGSRSSVLSSQCPEIPNQCIRELLMNGFVHRDYRVNSPIVIRAINGELEIESPGPLCTGLTPDSLLYCTPVYRNFLLAEGSRYLGLCDKVGRGIDAVVKGVLESGLGFPNFENGENHFTVRVSMSGNREFREFLKKRSQSLNQLDEIIVLRYLFDREWATFRDLCSAMQHGLDFGHKILAGMRGKLMIESDSSLNLKWRLSPILRNDIQNIFTQEQYRLGFEGLFGEQPLGE